MLKLDRFFGREEAIVEFPKSTTINCEVFNVEVVLVKKKNSSVSIKDDKLVFRLSSYLRNRQLKEHFDTLLERISKKVEKMNIRPNSFDFSKILKTGKFNFNNEGYTLEISNKISGIRFKDNIFYYNPTLDLEKIEKRIIKKIINIFEDQVEDYVKALNMRTYNYDFNSFKLKNLDSKWGHCTSNNDIMINVKLLNSRREVMDYVIIHELAHIRHKNHSQAFWNEVERYCPNHKVLRKELRGNPPTFFN